MLKVSIIIPVYNVAPYIERCARSLFEQTLDDIEYIFVDDCTPDLSVDIIKRTLDRYPNRKEQVRIIKQQENKGCPAARNLAVQLANGEFIFHVDADDYIEPDSPAEFKNNGYLCALILMNDGYGR